MTLERIVCKGGRKEGAGEDSSSEFGILVIHQQIESELSNQHGTALKDAICVDVCACECLRDDKCVMNRKKLFAYAISQEGINPLLKHSR